VGRVAETDASSELQSYGFTDPRPPYEAGALTDRLKQVDTSGRASYSRTVTVEREVNELELLETSPNPAQTRTTIRYALPDPQRVRLAFYDVLGRQVRTVSAPDRAADTNNASICAAWPADHIFSACRPAGPCKPRS
jgi:hypothetical protein